jgi:hypothetical protein
MKPPDNFQITLLGIYRKAGSIEYKHQKPGFYPERLYSNSGEAVILSNPDILRFW